MAFHEIRFPSNLSFGSVGGPERRTDIVTLVSGHEERNSPWSQSRRRYDAGMGLRNLDDLEALVAFFEARAGQLNGFRWKDWADFRSAPASQPITATDQVIGAGDGEIATFRLRKTYASGAQSHAREIRKPVAGTVRVALNGVALGAGWSVDPATGLVAFEVAPPAGAVVTAGFEFDVPVRFDTDRLLVSVSSFQAGDLPNVPVVEVRL